jgi:spermidine synthase
MRAIGRGADRVSFGAMQPLALLGETTTPDGTTLSLTRRGPEFIILANGKPLMSNRMHGSEEALATFGCARVVRSAAPVVLVGGLGMGYTLRATLDVLSADATVVVAELVPAVVEWNRGALADLARRPLEDPRVRVEVGDVGQALRASHGGFDAILLDVDNGPAAFTSTTNVGLYTDGGLAAAKRALRPGGVLAVWSAWDDRKFEQRLKYAGFRGAVEHVRARLKRGGPRHTIFLGYTD